MTKETNTPTNRLICGTCGEVGQLKGREGERFVSCLGKDATPGAGACCQTRKCRTDDEAMRRWDRLTEGK